MRYTGLERVLALAMGKMTVKVDPESGAYLHTFELNTNLEGIGLTEKKRFGGIKHYGFDGEELNLVEWLEMFESEKLVWCWLMVLKIPWLRIPWLRVVPTRCLARDEFGNDSYVSTVLLGLDHNWSNEGPPIIFETMGFFLGEEIETLRYATKEDALAGHRKVASAVRSSLRDVARYG